MLKLFRTCSAGLSHKSPYGKLGFSGLGVQLSSEEKYLGDQLNIPVHFYLCSDTSGAVDLEKNKEVALYLLNDFIQDPDLRAEVIKEMKNMHQDKLNEDSSPIQNNHSAII
ncbi:hypothetical protein ABLB84_16610 [Xenorhabdus szentirmaii]|uniref:hypothetical protein n=1 Tax=Xenorhabdus szentirmaii TaxID=290112 RepID=UPI0032B87A97